MNNFLEKIFDFIMIFRNKNNLNSTYSYSYGENKTFMSGTEHLTLNSKTEALKAEVKKDVEALANEYKNHPESFLNYAQKAGTPVFRINHADKLLSFIDEEEGVIFENKGIKALFLSIITKQGIKFNTGTMFILRNGTIDALSMLHNFYKWYSWHKKLPGFDSRSQWLFKRYMKYPNADLSKLPIDDIICAEEAVARDKEATEFCLKIARETDGAKNVQKKMNEEGGANI